MARFTHPQVVTANDLLTGEVVWLTRDHRWSPRLIDAAIARTEEEADALLAVGNERQHEIVGAYRADVDLDPQGRPVPVHFREAFRTRGPSNYFHGKQAGA